MSESPIARLSGATRFEPGEVEPRIARAWEESGLFHPRPEGEGGESYSIAIPPPNVTGSLHMGHALNGSIQDVLIRYHRMASPPGRPVKWILGTDHAGIPTQAQVEKALRAEGSTRQELGREAFLRRVWEWREHYGGTIVEQLKRLGASCDYSEERFTLDEDYARAVAEVFVHLYEKGLIYRDRYIVNWDPGSRSAISDLEVQEREETDTLYSIRYDLEGGGSVTIATVRPETLLAVSAVAVNPDDERYVDLVGRTAILPLVGRRLPVIADEHVKRDFGTGQLKITPAHDPNDFEIGRRHGLEQNSVIGEDGRMTADAGEAYAGLSVMEAREAVIAALEREGRIVASEPYVHAVPYSHRSGQRIEPLISLQWFMRMDELAAPAIEAVRSGAVRILPERHRKVYLDWMAEIRPWCISRQLWWGHRLPVFYCQDCEATHVAKQPPESCPGCGGPLTQEEDVLDTWFSSALWPFATLGWPERTPQLRAFYPTNVLSTARDILFLWVARMIMMGIELTGRPPFRDVYIHAIIQAPDGRRMSKSLGTGIDPLDLIDGGPRPPVFGSGSRAPGSFPAYGADALRWGLLAMASSQDVRFSEERIAQGQALANKLYNAVRFTMTKIAEQTEIDPDLLRRPQPLPRTVEDRWIVSRLQKINAQTTSRIEGYDFSHAALGLYDFIYGELCDWYIEMVKHRLLAGGEGVQDLALTLVYVISRTVALVHPILPFVTEELWSCLGGSGLLAGAAWPQPDPDLIDERAEEQVGRVVEAVTLLRGWRDSVAARPGHLVPARLAAEGYEQTAAALARLARLDLVSGNGAAPVAAVTVPGGTVEVLSEEGLDLNAAQRRREAERSRLAAEIERVQAKLANGRFLERAPAAVVQAQREKLARLRSEMEAL